MLRCESFGREVDRAKVKGLTVLYNRNNTVCLNSMLCRKLIRKTVISFEKKHVECLMV